jgi:hypothetical protein
MMSSYMKLVDMQYIDCLVDIFENQDFTQNNELLPFFIKFEFITMQSLTVILGDGEYTKFWSDKAKTRLLNYCMIVLLKAAGAYPPSSSGDTNTLNINLLINHIFYAEQHNNKHSLAHTIMTITELLRNDDNMKQFYKGHRPFKQLIVQLYKKYGAKSDFIRTDPGISYALNHLMRVLYIKQTFAAAQKTNELETQVDPNQHQQFNNINNNNENLNLRSDLNVKNEIKYDSSLPKQHQHQQESRFCSNPQCENEETKVTNSLIIKEYKTFFH